MDGVQRDVPGDDVRGIVAGLRARAGRTRRRIVLPESGDPRTLARSEHWSPTGSSIRCWCSIRIARRPRRRSARWRRSWSIRSRGVAGRAGALVTAMTLVAAGRGRRVRGGRGPHHGRVRAGGAASCVGPAPGVRTHVERVLHGRRAARRAVSRRMCLHSPIARWFRSRRPTNWRTSRSRRPRDRHPRRR